MFKVLVVVAVICVLGYLFVYDKSVVAESGEPVYGEMRIDLAEGSRNINLVLVAKMTSTQDCHERGQKVWKKALENCKSCQFKNYECKDQLAPRYMKLFDDSPLDTIFYLKARKGNEFERDGRIVVWGVSREESKRICEKMKSDLKVNYRGEVACVAGK